MTTEEDTNKVKPFIRMSEAVAVAYQELLSAEFHSDRLVVDDGAELLGEVVEHPHVVVAEEEVYFDAAVGQLGELAEEARVAARHQMAIGEPEVKDITQQHEGLAVRIYLFK